MSLTRWSRETRATQAGHRISKYPDLMRTVSVPKLRKPKTGHMGHLTYTPAARIMAASSTDTIFTETALTSSGEGSQKPLKLEKLLIGKEVQAQLVPDRHP